MKKRFWTRLVAAVLTTAMAFSILAVPASAAEVENAMPTSSWAVVYVGLDLDGGEFWVTDAMLKQQGEDADAILENMKNIYPQLVREENVPSYACVGLSNVKRDEIDENTEVTWYSAYAVGDIMDYIEDQKKIPEVNADGTVKVEKTIDGVTGTLTCYPVTDIDINASWAIKMPNKDTKITAWVTVDALDFFMGDKPENETDLIEGLVYYQSIGALYTGKIPDEAYVGFSKADGKTYWYDEKQIMAINQQLLEDDKYMSYETLDEGMDWDTGTFTLGDTVMEPIKELEPVVPSSPSSGSGSDGSAVAIVAVAGAAAAAATGVYFYTHPEKWQEIKDYFADLSANVQAKFQEFTDGVKGALGIPTEEAETAETVENAENAAVPQDAAA